jgi:hypothetical protein
VQRSDGFSYCQNMRFTGKSGNGSRIGQAVKHISRKISYSSSSSSRFVRLVPPVPSVLIQQLVLPSDSEAPSSSFFQWGYNTSPALVTCFFAFPLSVFFQFFR